MEAATKKLLWAFTTLLIGIVLIATISSEEQLRVEFRQINDENEPFNTNADIEVDTTEVHTVTNFPAGWKVNDCPISSVTIKNDSGAGATALTADTDYTLTASAGTWVFINTTATQNLVGLDNSTYVEYSYCADDYMNLSWGRTILDTVPGFFGIAILLVSIGLFFSIAKDYKII